MSSTTSEISATTFSTPSSTFSFFNKNAKLFLMGCILTCITNFFSAFSHTSINTAVDEVDEYLVTSYSKRGYAMDEDKILLIRGIYNTIYYAGFILGVVLGPQFPDIYGRKIAYMGTTFMMTTSCVIQSCATLTTYPEILIFGRFLSAIFAPMNDAAMLLYCQETSTPKIRGVLSSLFTTGYAVMALLGMVLGMKNVLGQNLTALMAVPIPFGLLGCVYLAYLEETPKFLMITRKDKNAAMKSLVFYQGEKPENDEILDDYLRESKEHHEHGSLLDFIRVPYLRKAVFLSNSALMLALPFFSIQLSSTFFMEKVGISDEFSQIGSILIAVLFVLTAFMATYLLKKFRRRPLFFISGISGVIFLCVFAICGQFPSFKYVSTAGIFGYMICFGLTLGPIAFSIAPELVPLQYRSSIICVVFSLISIFVLITNVAIAPIFEFTRDERLRDSRNSPNAKGWKKKN